MFECVQICTVSDIHHALQHTPPLRSTRRGSSGIECRPVQRVQRPGCGLPWYLPALVLAQLALLPVMCTGRPGARWGWGLHLWGIWGEPGGGVVDTSRRKNSKKAFSLLTHPLFSAQNAPPLLSISKISRKNKKTPTKGLCSVLYLPYKP